MFYIVEKSRSHTSGLPEGSRVWSLKRDHEVPPFQDLGGVALCTVRSRFPVLIGNKETTKCKEVNG